MQIQEVWQKKDQLHQILIEIDKKPDKKKQTNILIQIKSYDFECLFHHKCRIAGGVVHFIND